MNNILNNIELKDYSREEGLLYCAEIMLIWENELENLYEYWFGNKNDGEAQLWSSTFLIQKYNITWEEIENTYQLAKIYG